MLSLFVNSLLLAVVGETFASSHYHQHGNGWAMERSQVVPDVLEYDPKELLHVHYGDLKADNGNVLTPTQVTDAPKVSWNCHSGSLYTLIMVDPDAPSRKNPTMREYRHWLVVNIPGSDISKGDTCSDYYGSDPPKGTGYHRYVLAVYEQTCRVSVDKSVCAQEDMDRAGFSIKKFVKKYKLGRLVAANFFYAQSEQN